MKKSKPKPPPPTRPSPPLTQPLLSSEDDKTPNGEFLRPFPWVAPFPASKLANDEDGKETGEETVFVRAHVSQVIILNSSKYEVGEQTLPCNFAHQHSSILSAPK